MPNPHEDTTPQALGQSEAFLNFQENLSRVAPVDRPLLIVGERGTGKELAAKHLHYLSPRWQEPLIQLNCAALSPNLIEAELFGHEAGAFTGAHKRRPGLFEQAHNGTLFLDELGNIPLPVQEKILRVVEYGHFQRVGGAETITIDVRIIGATNADLPTLARQGRFMPDLLDRLSFEVLYLPPLRARTEDILLLAQHFAARMAYELHLPAPPEITPHAQTLLLQHPWPGNIRELKNTIERAVYRNQHQPLHHINFDPFQNPYPTPSPLPHQPPTTTNAPSPVPNQPPATSHQQLPPPNQPPTTSHQQLPHQVPNQPLATSHQQLPIDLNTTLRTLEHHYLQQALTQARHNQRKAATLLGLTYDQFRGLYRKHNNDPKHP